MKWVISMEIALAEMSEQEKESWMESTKGKSKACELDSSMAHSTAICSEKQRDLLTEMMMMAILKASPMVEMSDSKKEPLMGIATGKLKACEWDYSMEKTLGHAKATKSEHCTGHQL